MPPARRHQLQPSHGQRSMALGLATLREGHGACGATGSFSRKWWVCDDLIVLIYRVSEYIKTYNKWSWYKLILYVKWYLFLFVSCRICWCMRSMNAYNVLSSFLLIYIHHYHLLINLESCRFDFLHALSERKKSQSKTAKQPCKNTIQSALQSKDLQMFNILLAALCSTGAQWAKAFDLLRLRCQAEPWRQQQWQKTKKRCSE